MADGTGQPPTEPQGEPPSGSVSETATCCPLVSTFEGSPISERVRGFDPRTNLVANAGSDEYWIPPAKAKAAPSDRYRRDGAAWASVGLDQEVELEISFAGQSGNGCLVNCSFVTEPAGIVEVRTKAVAMNEAALKLRGLAEGETTLKVMCDGAELGWVHLVCYRPLIVRAVVTSISTPLTRTPAYDAARLEQVVNFVFRQALIRIAITDLGVTTLRSGGATAGEPALIDAATEQEVDRLERHYRRPLSEPWYSDGFGDLTGEIFAPAVSEEEYFAKDLTPIVRQQIAARSLSRLQLIYYIPNDLPSLFAGSVPVVGTGPAFCFKDFADATMPGYGIEDTYAILAHEIGHVFGLRHPDDGACTEIPAHLRSSIGEAVIPEDATNTEPAIDPSGKPLDRGLNAIRVMAKDPLNLMGYWPSYREQLYLRKEQWDLCRANAARYLEKNDG